MVAGRSCAQLQMHLSISALTSLGLLVGAASQCLPAPSITAASLLYKTSDAYASWTVDPSRNRLFFNVNFSDPRLVYLASEISGGVIRFGGSGGDFMTYAKESCGPLGKNEECLNMTTFDSVLALSAAASSTLVMGLNIWPTGGTGPSPPAGPWNSTNARILLTYIRDRAAPAMPPAIAFEIGNECDSNGFNAEQQAVVFRALADVLEEVFPVPGPVPRPALIGPDADGANGPPFYNSSLAHLSAFLGAFVSNASALGTPVSAVTFHEYIEVDSTTVLQPTYLDATGVNAASVVAAVRDVNATVPVWLGESGPHTGDSPAGSMVADCHNNGLCGRFGSVLWYADALGSTAAAGVALFARQDLVGGSYALINTSVPGGGPLYGDFNPSPDYYWLWVWQRVVAAGMLRVSPPAGAPATLRMYAFCARNGTAAGPDAAAVLVLVNLASTPVCMAVPSFVPPSAALTQCAWGGAPRASRG